MPSCTGSVSIGSLMPKFCLLKPVLGAGYSPWVRARSGISRHRCCRYQGRRANLTFCPQQVELCCFAPGVELCILSDPGHGRPRAPIPPCICSEISCTFFSVSDCKESGSPGQPRGRTSVGKRGKDERRQRERKSIFRLV